MSFVWKLFFMPHTFAPCRSRCSLAHGSCGNPLEIVWEALICLLLKTAPTEGLQEHSSSCWTCIAFNFYFLFLMFKSVHVLLILVICQCVFGGLIKSLVGFVLCVRQRWSIYWGNSFIHLNIPSCQAWVLMMGIGDRDQVTDGNWNA